MDWMSSRGPKEKVTDSQLIWSLKKIGGPAAATREVAEIVGLSNVHVRERLGQLEKEGLVKSKKFGNGTGWWVA